MQQVIISKFAETSPCFGCTKRTPFCHRIGQCELFTAWRARKEAFTQTEQVKRRGYQTGAKVFGKQKWGKAVCETTTGVFSFTRIQ